MTQRCIACHGEIAWSRSARRGLHARPEFERTENHVEVAAEPVVRRELRGIVRPAFRVADRRVLVREQAVDGRRREAGLHAGRVRARGSAQPAPTDLHKEEPP